MILSSPMKILALLILHPIFSSGADDQSMLNNNQSEVIEEQLRALNESMDNLNLSFNILVGNLDYEFNVVWNYIDLNSTSEAIAEFHNEKMLNLTATLAEIPHLPEDFKTKIQALIDGLNRSTQPQNLSMLAWNWMTHMTEMKEYLIRSQIEEFAEFKILENRTKRLAKLVKVAMVVGVVFLGMVIASFCFLGSFIWAKLRKLEEMQEGGETKNIPEVSQVPKRKFHLEISNPTFNVKSPETE